MGDQNYVLYQDNSLLKAFEIGKIGQIEAACKGAFGSDECRAILADPGSAAAACLSPLEVRCLPCSCSNK